MPMIRGGHRPASSEATAIGRSRKGSETSAAIESDATTCRIAAILFSYERWPPSTSRAASPNANRWIAVRPTVVLQHHPERERDRRWLVADRGELRGEDERHVQGHRDGFAERLVGEPFARLPVELHGRTLPCVRRSRVLPGPPRRRGALTTWRSSPPC